MSADTAFKYDPTDPYGYELILDLHDCDTDNFNRNGLTIFFGELCKMTDMELAEIHFWDDLYSEEEDEQTEPHLVGSSAICFIMTSNITIHTLPLLKRVYINFFTCKPFDHKVAEEYIIKYFNAKTIKQVKFMDRI